MPKIKIGTQTFTATPYDRLKFKKGSGLSDVHHLVKGADRVEVMWWHCKNGRDPDPFLKKFPAAGAGFSIYRDPTPGKPNKAAIMLASKEAKDDFLNYTGYATDNDLIAALTKTYGSYAPAFDVDAAIAPLKATRVLKVQVVLRYKHFVLSHSGIPSAISPGTVVMLSLPDDIWIIAKELAICTEDGVVPLKRKDQKVHLLEQKLVPPANKEAARLRRASWKLRLKEIEIAQAKLKKEKETVKKKLKEVQYEDE